MQTLFRAALPANRILLRGIATAAAVAPTPTTPTTPTTSATATIATTAAASATAGRGMSNTTGTDTPGTTSAGAATAMQGAQDYTQLFVNAAQTASYAEFRPSYETHCPQAFDAILAYARSDPALPFRTNLAVDIATGSGQAVKPLVSLFDKVIGLDASASQVKNAPLFPNVEYRVGDAHATGLEDGSVDLAVVAQALHWFDRPRFYKEAARILKPGGVLACLTYDAGVLLLPGSAVPPQPRNPGEEYRKPDPMSDSVSSTLNDIWLEEYRGDRGLGPYWTAPRVLVDRQYIDLEPLEPLFKDVTRQQFDMAIPTSVDALAGYVTSWSAYNHYKKKHPEAKPDPAERLKAKLRAVLNKAGVGDALNLVQTLTVVVGRKS